MTQEKIIGWKKALYGVPAHAKNSVKIVRRFERLTGRNYPRGWYDDFYPSLRVAAALVKLEIIGNVYSYEESAKLKTNKAKVLGVYSVPHKYRKIKCARSMFDPTFEYKTGEIVTSNVTKANYKVVEDFERSGGIFYFTNRRHALEFLDWNDTLSDIFSFMNKPLDGERLKAWNILQGSAKISVSGRGEFV